MLTWDRNRSQTRSSRPAVETSTSGAFGQMPALQPKSCPPRRQPLLPGEDGLSRTASRFRVTSEFSWPTRKRPSSMAILDPDLRRTWIFGAGADRAAQVAMLDSGADALIV